MQLGGAWIMLKIEKFFEKWPKAVSALISQRFPIDQASIPLSGKAGGIKNVIAVSG